MVRVRVGVMGSVLPECIDRDWTFRGKTCPGQAFVVLRDSLPTRCVFYGAKRDLVVPSGLGLSSRLPSQL